MLRAYPLWSCAVVDDLATRPSLLVRIRDVRDQEAWGEFVGIYLPVVYRFVRRLGLQDADAADTAQDVLQTVAARMPSFEYDPEAGKFRNWLLTVARSRAADLVERRRRQLDGTGDSQVEHTLDEQSARAVATDADWEQEYRRGLFDWAAQKTRRKFTDQTWQAFWLTSVEGQKTPDVARALDMSVGAIYIARSRVVAALRHCIEEAE
jgi:RNA polymerase sigma-70 factor (ECF subfamily)